MILTTLALALRALQLGTTLALWIALEGYEVSRLGRRR